MKIESFLNGKCIYFLMKSLFIIDGSGYLFRAYYGLPALTDKDGHAVHAIYGFLRMIFKVLAQKPEYFLIARDAPHKTLRHEAFEDYKAKRPPLPDDFKWQIRQTKELIKELNINCAEIPGYEADDIIATLADQCKKFSQVSIMTSDKDLKVLLDDCVVCSDPMKDALTTKESFINERGFEPKYFADYLALVGDSSDNIPGVKGIGPKAALMLITEYLTIENIYDHIDEITGAVKDKLVADKDMAFQSKKLVDRMSVPGREDIDPARLENHIDFNHRKEVLLNKYEFHSLEKQIDALKKAHILPQQAGLFW